MQAYDRNEEVYYGIRYGSTPILKDWWPLAIPSSVAVTSSFGAGAEIGSSATDGFYISSNLSNGYSKSYTYSNPSFTTAKIIYTNIVNWAYEFESKANERVVMESDYMYGIDNTGNDMLCGDIRVQLDYSFTVKNWIGIPHQSTELRDLFIRPATGAVYTFCNGFI